MLGKNLISILLIALFLCGGCAVNKEKSDGFETLFNGENFDGWYIKLKNNDEAMGKRVFQVDNGMVHVFGKGWPDEIDLNKGTDGTIGMLYTNKSYSMYHLKFQYKWGSKKANYFANWQYDAGIYYHVTDDKIFPTGVEYQIQYTPETDRNGTGDLIRPGGQTYDWYFDEKNDTYLSPDEGGILYTGQKSFKEKKWHHRGKITKNFNALNNEWNTCEVIAMGEDYVIHKLNGEVVNMAFNIKPSSGIIGFQSETAEIYYRNIEIKEFKNKLPIEEFIKTK